MQAFGHHDDIGGAVPGSMPSHATSVFEEGLMVPPIRLWDAGVPNKAALSIMTRNSRMPESLAADLDAECSACLMGARRLGELFDRYGVDVVESCFDAIIDRTTTTYRREILSKIPVGSWVWEDYAEHDGVDEPMLHTQRITLTRTSADDPDGERIILDFDGTGPQAKGPINHCGDYSDGVFLKKWLAPILRNLADTPERMAELDVNEGIVPLIEMRFPEPGTLLTPVFPAPTNARTFVILRLLGVLAGVVAKAVDGRMPADQETIRYTGVYGDDLDGRSYLMREVLGGGSGGRYYADGEDTIHVVPDSRNLPTEFTEARFPFRVESLGLAMDSGGPGEYRGGLGYEKHIRMLKDAHFMSIADRSILACWGVKGGLAGQPFQVTIDPGGPAEREVDALADAEPVQAGEVIRIRTTGGGGWGDPLARDPALVVRDVVWRKVSPEAALTAYGVVLTGSLDDDSLGHDADATSAERSGRPAAGEAFFDRGPGYARLADGAAHAAVDVLAVMTRSAATVDVPVSTARRSVGWRARPARSGLTYLRRCVELAREALEAGDEPFGSSCRRRGAGPVRGPQPGPGRRRDAASRVRGRPLVGVAPDRRRARRFHRVHLRRALPHVLRGARLDGARTDRVRRVDGAVGRLAGGMGSAAVTGASAGGPGGRTRRRGPRPLRRARGRAPRAAPPEGGADELARRPRGQPRLQIVGFGHERRGPGRVVGRELVVVVQLLQVPVDEPPRHCDPVRPGPSRRPGSEAARPARPGPAGRSARRSSRDASRRARTG